MQEMTRFVFHGGAESGSVVRELGGDGFTGECAAGEALDLHAVLPGIAAGLDERIHGVEITALHFDIGRSRHGTEAVVAVSFSSGIGELLFTLGRQRDRASSSAR